MKEGFFRRVSIDRETRTAHIETLIGTTTWYEEDIREGIDPENFDYTSIVEGANRVLRSDIGPYQYYWVTTSVETRGRAVKEKLGDVWEIFTRLHLVLRITDNQCI